jgi:hypothetical protein
MKTMKRQFNYIGISVLVLLLISCDDDSDLAIKRVAAPVTIDVVSSNANEITATVQELDKSGILDNTVGIVSTAVPGLTLEVFAAGTSLGTFVTDTEGKVIVTYPSTKPNEFVGTHKGVTFRIKK